MFETTAAQLEDTAAIGSVFLESGHTLNLSEAGTGSLFLSIEAQGNL